MAIIQTTDQIRYLRRKNLEEEARIIGNYYSDIISMHGIDCIYHKMDMSEFNNFKDIIDRNTILKKAYGYDITPDYNVSAEMVTFAEVDADVFNLNKIGYTPNTDINLIFDSVRFACDLAPKVGQFKEYPIEEREIICEVPAFNPENPSDEWPYQIGLDSAETYRCKTLEGQMRCVLSGYEIGVEQTVVCDPYEHTKFKLQFPKNNDLYYSLKHTIESDDYLETMLFLTFTVDEIAVGGGNFKYVLHGRIHGSVLFFDLDYLGKYMEKIHPMIGDIVEIDFPDENNREKYEITDCFDKQLTQDGINPLLHKYVWKCKARRYINSYEDNAPESNEADERLDERNRYDAVVQEEVAKEVSLYDDINVEKGIQEDYAYGGYDGVVDKYDKQDVRIAKKLEKYEFTYGMETIDVMKFGCGSRLVTDGYDLIFITKNCDAYAVAQNGQPDSSQTVRESCIKWIKATDQSVVFVNIGGDACVLAFDDTQVPRGIEISLEDIYNKTAETLAFANTVNDNFIKFRNTRTILFATEDSLYAKLASNGKAYRIV